jgi:hypothetical protein
LKRYLGMSTSYIPYNPEQQHLLPNALQDWLPQADASKSADSALQK